MQEGTALSAIRDLVMSRRLLTVDSSATVQETVEFLARHNIGAVPVMERERLAGIFSERDVIMRVITCGLDPRSTPVVRVMTRNVVVARIDETHETCLRIMQQAGCRHLPIVDGDTVVGMLSLRDLLQADISEKDDKLEFLRSSMPSTHR
jgi:CBS domain-containing protein